MTDAAISYLKGMLKAATAVGHTLMWLPDVHEKGMRVSSIGPPPPVAEGDDPEPAECAYSNNGNHVSLCFAGLDEFVILRRLSSEEVPKSSEA